jgi:hypothetical protein
MKLQIKIAIITLLSLIGLSAAAQSNTPRPLRFAWGANFEGGAEMSGHNMSTIGINGEFGLQYKWIRFVGASAQADITVGNSSRIYPLSLVFRTDFSNTQKLLFLDVRGGMALLYHEDDSRENSAYGSAGIGITFAHSKKFSSHLIVGYSYVGQDICSQGERLRKCPGISYATMRLGLAF